MNMPTSKYALWLILYFQHVLAARVPTDKPGVCGIPYPGGAPQFRADAELLSDHLMDLRAAVEVKNRAMQVNPAPNTRRLGTRTRHKKSGLFDVLLALTNAQRRALATVYCQRHLNVKTLHYPPKVHQIKDQLAFSKECLDPMFNGKWIRWARKGLVELNLSPEFANLIRAMLEPPPLYDARQLNRILTNILPASENKVLNLDALFNIWLNRDNSELKHIYMLYFQLYRVNFPTSLRFIIRDYRNDGLQKGGRGGGGMRRKSIMMQIKYLHAVDVCNVNCLNLLYTMVKGLEQQRDGHVKTPFTNAEFMELVGELANLEWSAENKVVIGMARRMVKLDKMHKMCREDGNVYREWLEDITDRMVETMQCRDHEELIRLLVSSSERNLMNIAVHYRHHVEHRTQGGLRESVKVLRYTFLVRNMLKDKVSNSYLYAVANLLFEPTFMNSVPGQPPPSDWFSLHCIDQRPKNFRDTLKKLKEIHNLPAGQREEMPIEGNDEEEEEEQIELCEICQQNPMPKPTNLNSHEEVKGLIIHEEAQKSTKIFEENGNSENLEEQIANAISTDSETDYDDEELDTDELKALHLMKERFSYIYGKDFSKNHQQRSTVKNDFVGSLATVCAELLLFVRTGHEYLVADADRVACYPILHKSLQDQAQKVCGQEIEAKKGGGNRDLCAIIGGILAGA